MLPLELQEWLFNEGFEWQDDTSVSGGDTCSNLICRNQSGEAIFVKYMVSPPPNFFQCEAEGLAYLSQVSNVRTPSVYAYGDSYLVLEYILPNQLVPDFWQQLGHQLAAIHSFTRDQHGFVNDNYCGRTLQLNSFVSEGVEFFAEQRLLPLSEQAYDRGRLAVGDLHAIEALCLRLSNLVPEQSPALLHGDLWSGNVHVSDKGLPVLIDPAVYFSWPEIDIAMTRLFGTFDQRFYDAYNEVAPMEHGWASRMDLYNLYPLLNHLNLFGSSYLPKIRDILAEYA